MLPSIKSKFSLNSDVQTSLENTSSEHSIMNDGKPTSTNFTEIKDIIQDIVKSFSSADSVEEDTHTYVETVSEETAGQSWERKLSTFLDVIKDANVHYSLFNSLFNEFKIKNPTEIGKFVVLFIKKTEIFKTKSDLFEEVDDSLNRIFFLLEKSKTEELTVILNAYELTYSKNTDGLSCFIDCFNYCVNNDLQQHRNYFFECIIKHLLENKIKKVEKLLEISSLTEDEFEKIITTLLSFNTNTEQKISWFADLWKYNAASAHSESIEEKIISCIKELINKELALLKEYLSNNQFELAVDSHKNALLEDNRSFYTIPKIYQILISTVIEKMPENAFFYFLKSPVGFKIAERYFVSSLNGICSLKEDSTQDTEIKNIYLKELIKIGVKSYPNDFHLILVNFINQNFEKMNDGKFKTDLIQKVVIILHEVLLDKKKLSVIIQFICFLSPEIFSVSFDEKMPWDSFVEEKMDVIDILKEITEKSDSSSAENSTVEYMYRAIAERLTKHEMKYCFSISVENVATHDRFTALIPAVLSIYENDLEITHYLVEYLDAKYADDNHLLVHLLRQGLENLFYLIALDYSEVKKGKRQINLDEKLKNYLNTYLNVDETQKINHYIDFFKRVYSKAKNNSEKDKLINFFTLICLLPENSSIKISLIQAILFEIELTQESFESLITQIDLTETIVCMIITKKKLTYENTEILLKNFSEKPLYGNKQNSELLQVIKNIRDMQEADSNNRILNENYQKILLFLVKKLRTQGDNKKPQHRLFICMSEDLKKGEDISNHTFLTPNMALAILENLEIFYILTKKHVYSAWNANYPHLSRSYYLPVIFEMAAKNAEEARNKIPNIVENMLVYFSNEPEKLQSILDSLFFLGDVKQRLAPYFKSSEIYNGRSLRDEILDALEKAFLTNEKRSLDSLEAVQSESLVMTKTTPQKARTLKRGSIVSRQEIEVSEEDEAINRRYKVIRKLIAPDNFYTTMIFNHENLTVSAPILGNYRNYLLKQIQGIDSLTGVDTRIGDIAALIDQQWYKNTERVVDVLFSSTEANIESNVAFIIELIKNNSLFLEKFQIAFFEKLEKMDINDDTDINKQIIACFIFFLDQQKNAQTSLLDQLSTDNKLLLISHWPRNTGKLWKPLKENLLSINMESYEKIPKFVDGKSESPEFIYKILISASINKKEKDFFQALAQTFLCLSLSDLRSSKVQQKALLKILCKADRNEISVDNIKDFLFYLNVLEDNYEWIFDSEVGIPFFELTMIVGFFGEEKSLGHVVKGFSLENKVKFNEKLYQFLCDENVLKQQSLETYNNLFIVYVSLEKQISQQKEEEKEAFNQRSYEKLNQIYLKSKACGTTEKAKKIAKCLLGNACFYDGAESDSTGVFETLSMEVQWKILEDLCAKETSIQILNRAFSTFMNLYLNMDEEKKNQSDFLMKAEGKMLFLCINNVEMEKIELNFTLFKQAVDKFFNYPSINNYSIELNAQQNSFVYDCLIDWLKERDNIHKLLTEKEAFKKYLGYLTSEQQQFIIDRYLAPYFSEPCINFFTCQSYANDTDVLRQIDFLKRNSQFCHSSEIIISYLKPVSDYEAVLYDTFTELCMDVLKNIKTEEVFTIIAEIKQLGTLKKLAKKMLLTALSSNQHVDYLIKHSERLFEYLNFFECTDAEIYALLKKHYADLSSEPLKHKTAELLLSYTSLYEDAEVEKTDVEALLQIVGAESALKQMNQLKNAHIMQQALEVFLGCFTEYEDNIKEGLDNTLITLQRRLSEENLEVLFDEEKQIDYALIYHSTQELYERINQHIQNKNFVQGKKILEKMLLSQQHARDLCKNTAERMTLFDLLVSLKLSDEEAKQWMEFNFSEGEIQHYMPDLLIAYRVLKCENCTIDLLRQWNLDNFPGDNAIFLRSRVSKAIRKFWIQSTEDFLYIKKNWQFITHDFTPEEIKETMLDKIFQAADTLYFEERLKFVVQKYEQAVFETAMLSFFDKHPDDKKRFVLSVCCDPELLTLPVFQGQAFFSLLGTDELKEIIQYCPRVLTLSTLQEEQAVEKFDFEQLDQLLNYYFSKKPTEEEKERLKRLLGKIIAHKSSTIQAQTNIQFNLKGHNVFELIPEEARAVCSEMLLIYSSEQFLKWMNKDLPEITLEKMRERVECCVPALTVHAHYIEAEKLVISIKNEAIMASQNDEIEQKKQMDYYQIMLSHIQFEQKIQTKEGQSEKAILIKRIKFYDNRWFPGSAWFSATFYPKYWEEHAKSHLNVAKAKFKETEDDDFLSRDSEYSTYPSEQQEAVVITVNKAIFPKMMRSCSKFKTIVQLEETFKELQNTLDSNKSIYEKLIIVSGKIDKLVKLAKKLKPLPKDKKEIDSLQMILKEIHQFAQSFFEELEMTLPYLPANNLDEYLNNYDLFIQRRHRHNEDLVLKLKHKLNVEFLLPITLQLGAVYGTLVPKMSLIYQPISLEPKGTTLLGRSKGAFKAKIKALDCAYSEIEKVDVELSKLYDKLTQFKQEIASDLSTTAKRSRLQLKRYESEIQLISNLPSFINQAKVYDGDDIKTSCKASITSLNYDIKAVIFQYHLEKTVELYCQYSSMSDKKEEYQYIVNTLHNLKLDLKSKGNTYLSTWVNTVFSESVLDESRDMMDHALLLMSKNCNAEVVERYHERVAPLMQIKEAKIYYRHYRQACIALVDEYLNEPDKKEQAQAYLAEAIRLENDFNKKYDPTCVDKPKNENYRHAVEAETVTLGIEVSALIEDENRSEKALNVAKQMEFFISKNLKDIGTPASRSRLYCMLASLKKFINRLELPRATNDANIENVSAKDDKTIRLFSSSRNSTSASKTLLNEEALVGLTVSLVGRFSNCIEG
jgi:hypothetical protein